ncbi:hypothetical protein DXG01_010745, partial [Tephrocybe rancida]
SSLASTTVDMLSEWDSLSSWTEEHGCTFTFRQPSDVDAYTLEFASHTAYILRRHPGLELPGELSLWFYQGIPVKYRSVNRACLLRLLLSHVEDVPFPTMRELVKILKDEITYDIKHPDAEYPLFPIHPKIIDLVDSYCYRNVPDTRLLARIYSTSLNAEYSSSDPVELLKSSHRTQELSHLDIHGPIDHVVPIAVQSLTNSAMEPAIAALTPNAIIDDVKHNFCPPTTTAAPPLEQPPPRPPSD